MNPDPSAKEKKTEKWWKAKIKKFSLKHYFLFAVGMIILLTVVGSLLANLQVDNIILNKDQAVTSDSLVKDPVNNEMIAETTPEIAESEIPFDISKIIYSGNISLYTDNYQNTFEKIGAYAMGLGGFVQDSSSSYMIEDQNIPANSGYITIRVPAEKFTEVMAEILTYGEPISSSINSTNISQEYQDIKVQLDNLKIQEERLQGYLTKAENITDMLLIESELNRVRTEIDNRSTTIKNWDKEIAYSTIYVLLYEKELSTSTVESPFSDILKQISEGFIASINLILKMFEILIVWIFKLLPFAAVVGLGYFIYIKFNKKKL